MKFKNGDDRRKKIIEKLKEENNYRQLRVCDDTFINLSSNDYILLAEDSLLKKVFFEKYEFLPLSSSSSRLITGTYKIIDELEKELYKIYNKSALLFNSGFDANSCIIETLFNKETLIISDRLNHSSIYSGIISSNSKLLRYPHLDINFLENILIKNNNKHEEIVVITESIYSMDGDSCDLKKLVNLKKIYNFKLMVDEAHTYGVKGYGECYNQALLNCVDYLVIPLGKGGGSIGAYFLCNEETKNFIINRGKQFIYSTALPPLNSAWNLFILQNMNSFYERIEKLEKLKNFTLELLKENNIYTSSTSHIISLIIPNKLKLMKLVDSLTKKKFLVYAIKEPTVPKGTSRLRIGLNNNISEQNIRHFIEVYKNEIDNIF